jgi:O-antigen ligase
LFDPAVEEALRDPNNLSRPAFLLGAAQLFVASPLIGGGFGAFAATGFDLYPHNLVAEVASELGLLGLLALAAWIVVALRASIHSAILTALFAATFVFSLVSGNIAGEAEFWFFSALAVGALPVARSLGSSPDVPRTTAAARGGQA